MTLNELLYRLSTNAEELKRLTAKRFLTSEESAYYDKLIEEKERLLRKKKDIELAQQVEKSDALKNLDKILRENLPEDDPSTERRKRGIRR